MERQADTASWMGDRSGLRVLGSELLSLVRVVGALPWRSMAADTLGELDTHRVPVVFVHGMGASEYLNIERRASHIVRRIRALLGKEGKHWMT